MLPSTARAFFESAYSNDLVFEPDCWKLCGDAHCCSFSRHKAKFSLFTETPQELPLLPGEWAFLCEQGWNVQFGDHEIRPHSYEVDGYTLRWTSMVSRRPMCACDHATRTVVCRLYPLLPTYTADGHVTGGDRQLGMYEELEVLEGLEPACKLESLPFDQLNLFNELANGIGANPVWRYYLMAYSLTKRHVFDRLAAKRDGSVSAFRQFEMGLFRKRLFDHDALRADLRALLNDVAGDDLADFLASAEVLHDADAAHIPADAAAH